MTTPWIRLVATACTGLVVAAVAPKDAAAQAVWQADVRVQSLLVKNDGKQMAINVTLYSDNDDDARSVRVEILLPVGVGVLRLPPGCTASPAVVPNLNGRITCDIGDLPVRGLYELTLTTTGVVPRSAARVGVFVMSDTPDPQPANNYAERVVP